MYGTVTPDLLKWPLRACLQEVHSVFPPNGQPSTAEKVSSGCCMPTFIIIHAEWLISCCEDEFIPPHIQWTRGHPSQIILLLVSIFVPLVIVTCADVVVRAQRPWPLPWPCTSAVASSIALDVTLAVPLTASGMAEAMAKVTAKATAEVMAKATAEVTAKVMAEATAEVASKATVGHSYG
jgi:hypothetical protein